jgi:hypothetical protein
MSHDSGFRLFYIGAWRPPQLIDMFLSFGWTLDYDGEINILPLGDDEFNWTLFKMSEIDDVFSIIDLKSSLNEIVGVRLTWTDTKSVLYLVFEKNNSIIFDVAANRQLLGQTDFTDINWYLQRTLFPLLDNRVQIEQIVWREHV